MNKKIQNLSLVSIVIPTHNRSDMLQRALSSVFNQTYQNIEVIVVDDGSQDDTQEVLKNYIDSRLKVLKNEVPKGACNARNKGIQEASGEFVTFLDDDDEYLPQRIEKLMAVWDDKWAYITTGMFFIKNSGKTLQFIPEKIINLSELLHKNSVGNSVLTKKERLSFLGGFDETLKSSQDYDMWVRLSIKYGDGYSLQEPLYITHTEHDKPRISASKNKVMGHFDFYKKHKHLMTHTQRKSQLFELYRNKNKKIGIAKAMSFGEARNKTDILKYVIKSRFSKIIGNKKLVFLNKVTKIF